MRAGRVLVVGSINVDLVVTVERLPAEGETVTGGRFVQHGGGKGANQAVAAARRGAAVRLVGAVGDDDHGREALAALRDEGVDVSGVATVDAPTGVAAIVVDAAGRNQIAVASGANALVDAALVRDRLAALGGAYDVLLLSHETSADANAAAIQAAARAGARIVVDPAPARPLDAETLLAGPILTPNRAEAETLTGEPDPSRAARALHGDTHAPVVVTLGAEGALALDEHGERHIAAPRVEVVDTTGAGDALAGALAALLARGVAFEAAADEAVAAASASVTAAGARAGLARRR